MLLYINNNLQSSFNDFFYMNKDIHEYITGYPNDILKMSTNVVQSVSFVALGFLYSSHTIDIDISSINQGSLASEHRRISGRPSWKYFCVHQLWPPGYYKLTTRVKQPTKFNELLESR